MHHSFHYPHFMYVACLALACAMAANFLVALAAQAQCVPGDLNCMNLP